jgi:hypothetical protein
VNVRIFFVSEWIATLSRRKKEGRKISTRRLFPFSQNGGGRRGRTAQVLDVRKKRRKTLMRTTTFCG